jgi:hypothetical protein
MTTSDNRTSRALASVHALYFLIGGAWAVLGKRTFEAVTGPKVDYWLVRTVGGLLSVAGIIIASAALRNRVIPEIRWLAMGTSGVLASVSLIYSAKGRIRPIYLLDTIANILLIMAWIRAVPEAEPSTAQTEPFENSPRLQNSIE